MTQDSLFSHLVHWILLVFLITGLKGFSQDSLNSIPIITSNIITEKSAEEKLKWNEQLRSVIENKLKLNAEKIELLKDTLLLYELTSHDNRLQIITWAIEFDEIWEYFGFVKSYNQQKKLFEVWELVPTNFKESLEDKQRYSNENWPAAVYIKLIETNYNNKDIYTLIGWLANDSQTAHKILDVLIIEKNGKISFGKSDYFYFGKDYKSRLLFSYQYQSKFLLDYGEYSYSERKWNSKKKRYDINNFQDEMIVFDHLIPLYPDLKDYAEFLVPAGNIIDAFVFEKGKWRIKEDIDARNLQVIEKKREKPNLNLFPTN